MTGTTGHVYDTVYVCQYSPSGNVRGQFGANVGELWEWNTYSNTHAGSAYNAHAGSYNVVEYDKSPNNNAHAGSYNVVEYDKSPNYDAHAGIEYEKSSNNAPSGSYNVVVYDKSSNPIKVYSSKTSNNAHTQTVPGRIAETLGTDNTESMTGRITSKGVMGLQAPTDAVQKVTTASKTRSTEVKTPTKVTATKKIATKTKVTKQTTVIKVAPKKTRTRMILSGK